MAYLFQRWHPTIPRKTAIQNYWDYEDIIWMQKKEIRNKLRLEIRAALNELKQE